MQVLKMAVTRETGKKKCDKTNRPETGKLINANNEPNPLNSKTESSGENSVDLRTIKLSAGTRLIGRRAS